MAIPYARRAYDLEPAHRLVDLLLRRGDIQARGLSQESAGKQEAARSLGQLALQGMDRYRQGQIDERDAAAAAQEGTLRQLQIDAATRSGQAAEQTQADDLRRRGIMRSGGTRAEILKQLERDPEGYAKAQEHFASVDAAKNRLWGTVAAAVRDFGDSPDAAMAGLDEMIRMGFDERALEGIRARIQQDPKSVPGIIDHFLKNSPDEAHQARVTKPPERGQYLNLGAGGVFDTATRSVVEGTAQPPDAPSRDPNPTEASLAARAAAGDEQAKQALKILRDQRATDRSTGGTQMSPSMEANVINRLSTQWQRAVAPVAELDRQGKIMDAALDAARRGDIAQGSEALLVTFQKILDPTSVVRETEAMRSVGMQSLMSRAQGALQRIQQGGSGLTLAEQEKYATLARELITAQVGGYLKAQKERIGKTADRYNIPRELIFEDYEFGKPTSGKYSVVSVEN